MKRAICIAVSIVLAGCATGQTGENYRPIVDTKGRDAAQYENDLRECQAYAAQAAGAAQQAAAGAAAGAIFGALLTAAAGNNYSRNRSAMVGGLLGGAGGAAQGETDQRNIIRTCLNNRGYSVLQ